MCIAIHSPADSRHLTVDEFNFSLENNPHGMGLLYAEDGEFKIIKTLTRADLIWKEYRKAHKRGIDCLVHFRIKTYGEKKVENCHPFMHGTELAYIHNGTLPLDVPKDEVDSKVFSERVLQHLPENWWDIPEILKMVERFTSGSKICFMNRQNQTFILNQNLGHIKDGLWFSNYGYRKRERERQIGFHDNWSYEFGKTHQSDWKASQDRNGWKSRTDEKGEKWESRYGYGHTEKRSSKYEVPEVEEEVDYDNLFNTDHPAGFIHFGFFLCSYCASHPEYDVAADQSMIPVFRHDEDYDNRLPKDCEVCTITITDSSPVCEAFGFWNRITGTPVDENKDDKQINAFDNLDDEVIDIRAHFESVFDK